MGGGIYCKAGWRVQIPASPHPQVTYSDWETNPNHAKVNGSECSQEADGQELCGHISV